MTVPLFLSVIMPARNGSAVLPTALEALIASDLPRSRWELIIVDDASTDDTAAISARYADAVIRIPGRAHGPAYARNRGAEVARGDIVVFFDADVVVHENTLRLFAEVLEARPELGGAFGSYDDRPPAPGLMSQYRNLLHHYTHQQNGGEAASFWAGAGAIRRSIFLEAGMYDEWHFARPQIEDIELGARICHMGHRIVLQPEIQVTHLKQWTLGSVVRTDLRDRGIPWARLLAHRGGMLKVGTLNLKWTEKLNVILVWGAVLFCVSWFPLKDNRVFYAALACLSAVIVINWRLWAFFARVRGPVFAARTVPAHLLYYLINGISFGTGLLLQQAVGAPLPDPTVEAWHEVGVQRWPPIPSKHRRSSWTAGNE
ncbi:MAG: glycosyltransferase family A protein [Gemmatimonadaceae bacterium]